MRFTRDNKDWERVPNSTEAASAILVQNTQKILVFSDFTSGGGFGTRRA
jgi:hypothetical protein